MIRIKTQEMSLAALTVKHIGVKETERLGSQGAQKQTRMKVRFRTLRPFHRISRRTCLNKKQDPKQVRCSPTCFFFLFFLHKDFPKSLRARRLKPHHIYWSTQMESVWIGIIKLGAFFKGREERRKETEHPRKEFLCTTPFFALYFHWDLTRQLPVMRNPLFAQALPPGTHPCTAQANLKLCSARRTFLSLNEALQLHCYTIQHKPWDSFKANFHQDLILWNNFTCSLQIPMSDWSQFHLQDICGRKLAWRPYPILALQSPLANVHFPSAFPHSFHIENSSLQSIKSVHKRFLNAKRIVAAVQNGITEFIEELFKWNDGQDAWVNAGAELHIGRQEGKKADWSQCPSSSWTKITGSNIDRLAHPMCLDTPTPSRPVAEQKPCSGYTVELLTACWVPLRSLTLSGGRTLLSIRKVLKLFMKLLEFRENVQKKHHE